MDTKMLKVNMIMKDISVDALCKQAGMSKTAFYRKVNGKSEFTQKEIQSIAKTLGLTKGELCCIFFDEE